MVYNNYAAAMLRSAGDTKHPLIFLSISGVLNVVLNLFLVVVCGLGVEGVAIATIFSQYVSALMILVFMHKHGGDVAFTPRKLRIDVYSLKKILIIGIPSGVQTALFSLSNVTIQASINSFGDIAMAGNSAASNLEGFVHTSMVSVYHASMTFVGQNVGAKKYHNIKKVTALCLGIVFVVGFSLSSFILAFREPLIMLYADNSTVMEYAEMRMFVNLPIFFFCGMMDVMSGVVRGMGKSVVAMINSLTAIVIRIAWVECIFFFLPREFQTLYYAFPISWIAVLILHLIFFVIFYRRLIARQKAEIEVAV